LVAEPGTFQPWDVDVVSRDPLAFADTKPYRQRLNEAAEHTGVTESVVAGQARVAGHDAALIVGDFGFLAGTMGLAASERLLKAFERAADLRLPILAMPVSGGTRMQEGTPAFVQMAAVAAAAQRFRSTGLPYVVYLRNPTTGGVLGSWALLGHVTFAEPDALIGLTGPRVSELIENIALPRHVQRAEHLAANGLIDDVVEPDALATRFARVLTAAAPHSTPGPLPGKPLPFDHTTDVDPWTAVERSRRSDRPGIRELMAACAHEVTDLRGDGAGNDDPGCVAAIARIAGVGAVIVGHDRPPGERGARLTPAGHRKARTAMRLAEELGLALVTVIDTPGALNTAEAEESGMATEIALSLATMSTLEIPTLALLLGEGTGASAIAFLPADRVIVAEHAWLAPLAPEGASAILHRTTDRAAELASKQAIVSTDLVRNGIADVAVPDRPEAGEEGSVFGQRVAATAAAELLRLVEHPPHERRRQRAQRWRRLSCSQGPAPDTMTSNDGLQPT